MIASDIQSKIPTVLELFRANKIKSAYLFGSVLTDRFSEASDVDFLVSFQDGLDPLERGELWWKLHDSLREKLKREVDIVTESSLKNPYFIKDINATKVKIYG